MEVLIPIAAVALVALVFVLRRRRKTPGCPRCD
jgi:hypothetical protein